MQGPVRWTFSSTAVGFAHVSASGLANVPLKPHLVVLVWVCVFLFKEKQLQGQERMAVLEKLPMPRARLIHSGPGPRATPSRRPGHRAPPSSRMPALPPQASGSGQHGIDLPSAFSDEGLPPGGAQISCSACSLKPSSPGRAEPRARAQLPQPGLHPEHLPGLGPPSMPPEPQTAPSSPP